MSAVIMMGVVRNNSSARFSRLPLWVTGWLVLVVLPAVGLGGERLRTVETEASIEVLCGDALVLRYNKVAPKAPDEARRVYERSGYIHPLYSPQGRMVSGDFAADHPHQHGLFVAWKNTSFQGRQLDFWNHHAKTGTGTVLHDHVVAIQDDPHVAGFQVAVKHCAIDPPASQQVILKDVWTVRVQVADDDLLGRHYIVDFQVAQTNVTEHPLTINEYHYGGVGFRGSNSWYSDKSAKALSAAAKTPDQPLPAMEVTRHRFLTSEGKDRRLGNHSRPDWTMLYGFVDDGQVAGVRVTPLETNLRYPDPMRLHPTKPYFSISPCVAGAFDLLPGETYRADYRFEIFDGAPES